MHMFTRVQGTEGVIDAKFFTWTAANSTRLLSPLRGIQMDTERNLQELGPRETIEG